MSLLEVQTLLAELYTSAPLRQEFRRYPRAVSARYGLEAEEGQKLESLDWAAVERFARSLVRKRLKLVRSTLPATCALLGSGLFDIFRVYCEQAPLRKRLRSYEEAYGFASFLDSDDRQTPETERRTSPPYTRQVMAYERFRVELLSDPEGLLPVRTATELRRALETNGWRELRLRCGPQVRVERFTYPIDELCVRLTQGEGPKARPGPVSILYLRQPDEERVARRRIKPSTEHLLGLCDGSRTGEKVIDELAGFLDLGLEERPSLEGECCQFLHRLAEAGVLGLGP